MSSSVTYICSANSLAGPISIAVFVIAYVFIILEEFLHLRKSKPVIFASGIIWFLIAYTACTQNLSDAVHVAVKHYILEFAELFLFLIVAMTYINAMQERNVFNSLRCWLTSRGYSYKQLFWITGFLAFFISPVADNLTTALIMCAVIMTTAKENIKFASIACINIVIAANAGGAFSPFGDITTLMVWQAGIIKFMTFFKLFIPSVVAYLVPAVLMSFAIPNSKPKPHIETIKMKNGAKRMIALFLVTICFAITFHSFLHLPPAIGMMMGLSMLKLFGYSLKMKDKEEKEQIPDLVPFDIIKKIERVEWDTLLFFYGVIMCVGGLATLGYLKLVSTTMYTDLGSSLSVMHQATPANILVGFLSAVIDNIPVMFAVLTMNPEMSEGQWLLVTLTAGIGGSMLSIGSAAGVALMGQARGVYTFFSHLKWAPAIALGYFLAIGSHFWINNSSF